MPIKKEMLDLASEAALLKVSRGEETMPLLVRRPLTRKNDIPIGRVASILNDDPTRISVNMMLRPPALQRCHAHLL